MSRIGRVANRLEGQLEARPWLVVVVALMISVPTLVLGEISAADTRSRLREAQLQSQHAAAARAANRVTYILGDVADHLVDTTRPNSAIVAAVSSGDQTALQTAVQDVAQRFTFTPAFYFVNAQGIVVAGATTGASTGAAARVIGARNSVLAWADTDHSRIGTRFMSADDLARTFSTSAIFLSDMYIPRDLSGEEMRLGTSTGRPRPGEERPGYIAAMATRVQDRSGRLAGALVADIVTAPFIDAIFELQGIADDAYLIDRRGHLVRRMRYFDRDGVLGTDLSGASAIKTVLAGETLGSDGLDPFTGRDALLVSVIAPDMAGLASANLDVGWTIIAAQPLDRVYADVDAGASLVRFIRVALALGIVVVAALLTLALRRVVRQRAALVSANTALEAASQQIEAATRHKSEFLANMSHELRTPLNAIIGFADVLEQKLFGDLNAKQAEYVGDISGSGRHLLALVNEILDLSKVEAGRMELERTEFAVAETIRSTVTFIRERAASHAIQLAIDLPEDLGSLNADERKIRQVILNLLSNAVKFTPGGGTIRISARRVNDELVIAVADTGIGIAPEDQAKVFEEFRQVGRQTDRSREGTGLGLTLAKKFVELHGGRIWLESQVGAGTTFTFALPQPHTAPVTVTA